MFAARTLLALVLLLGASPAVAVLAPQYTTWQDFAAITSQSAIPRQLGVVDRIERTGGGAYIVRAGKCSIEVKVLREGTSGPGGQAIAGPSHVARVEIGDKRCAP
jgi:hypothetical protein